MKAGRELNLRVAVDVMGWNPVYVPEGSLREDAVGKLDYYVTPDGHFKPCGWSPSTDIASAWEVVEKLKSSGLEPMLEWDAEDEMWFCSLSRYDAVTTFSAPIVTPVAADTAPLAICIAALRAVGADVEENE